MVSNAEMFAFMEGVTWVEVRNATESGNAMVLMQLHKCIKEFAKVRACEAVQKALEAAPRKAV